MAITLADRVFETCTTTGTGALSLLGAVAKYQSFNSGVGNLAQTYYEIEDQSGTNWEGGIGTYTTSGSTLSRTTVLFSSNAGALVNFTAGTKNVYCNYPAGTSVSGGGGGTYPTIRPTLDLDFANSRTLDPRITFARATTATYYDGKTTAMAEQNLLLQSQSIGGTNWGSFNSILTSNIAVAPDGTTTAATLIPDTTSNSHNLYQTFSGAISGATYVFSVYLKASGYNYAILQTQFGGINVYYSFNISAGVIGTINGGATPTIVSVGSGWYRCSLVLPVTVATTANPVTLWSISTDTTAAFVGDGTSGMQIWGAQLEQRSSATAYTKTTTTAITNYIPVLMTAPAGVPRLDYNPTTGQALGLLIEDQRVNLLTYSSDFFSNAVWTKNAIAITTATNIAPDGTQTATKIIPIATSGFHEVYQTATVTATAVYTQTCYMKMGEYQYGYLYNTGSTTGIIFNLANGTLGSVIISAPTSSSITPVGNGWYKCSITYTNGAGTSAATWIGASNSSSTGNITGDGYSGIYIWGAQLEAGAFATSYIPTTSAQVTRNADQASMQGTNFSSWYNQAQGTVCVDYDFNATIGINANAGIFALNNYNTVVTVISRVDIRYANAANTSNGVGLNVPNVGTMLTGGKLNKIASSYSVASSIYASNYGTTSTYSLTVMPNPMTQFIIGGIDANVGQTGGHIRKIAYYPQALSSQNLVALTS
jgi:hypothetical protein